MIKLGDLPLYMRTGDDLVHIGPPTDLGIPTDSPLFQTRCGLETVDGPWRTPSLEQARSVCGDCLLQAGLDVAPTHLSI